MQAEQSISDRIQRSKGGMDTSLEWKIIVGQRRFTSWHRMIAGEEEDRNNHVLLSSKWLLTIRNKMQVGKSILDRI